MAKGRDSPRIIRFPVMRHVNCWATPFASQIELPAVKRRSGYLALAGGEDILSHVLVAYPHAGGQAFHGHSRLDLVQHQPAVAVRYPDAASQQTRLTFYLDSGDVGAGFKNR